MSKTLRLDRKIGFQNTFYTKFINVIIDSVGPSIVLWSIYRIRLIFGLLISHYTAVQTGLKIDSNTVEYASSGVSWDSEIRPEDCRLALQGLTIDDKRRSRGTDFSIPSSQ